MKKLKQRTKAKSCTYQEQTHVQFIIKYKENSRSY